jgi:hypothetical protein
LSIIFGQAVNPDPGFTASMNKHGSPPSRIHLIALMTVLFIALNSVWLNLFGTLDNRLSDFVARHVAKQLSPDPDIYTH